MSHKQWLKLQKHIPSKFFISEVTVPILDILIVLIFVTGFTIYNSTIGLLLFIMSLVLLFHEMGHLFWMRKFSYTHLKLHMFGFIAFARGWKEPYRAKEQLIVILGGAVPGILLGSMLYFINQFFETYLLGLFSHTLIIINFINLFPFLPLDGGNYVKILIYGDKLYPRVIHQAFSTAASAFAFFLTKEPLIIMLLLFMGLAFVGSLIEVYEHNFKKRRFRRVEYNSMINNLSGLQMLFFWGIIGLLYAFGFYFYYLFFVMV